MVSYQDVPECDQSVLINETGPDAAGRAKPRPWRLGMGLTLVGAVCFMSYWSGLSIRGGAKLTIPQDRASKFKRALLSLSETLPRVLAEDVKLTQHASIQLGPTDLEGEPEKMTVKLTLEPREDAEDAEDAKPVSRWAFKYKDGMGEDMKKVIEEEIASHQEQEEDMTLFEPPTVTLDEEQGLVYVDEVITLSEDEVAQVKEVDLEDDTVVFEMSTGRDLSEMIAHDDESIMVVHGGIKVKAEVSMMAKVEMKVEEIAAAEAENALPGGVMIGQVIKCIRALGLDATFKYSEPALSEVASSMGIPTFAEVLGMMRQDLDEEMIAFFTKLKDSADGLDHLSVKGLPKSPNYLLEFANFHLTDFLVELADTRTPGGEEEMFPEEDEE